MTDWSWVTIGVTPGEGEILRLAGRTACDCHCALASGATATGTIDVRRFVAIPNLRKRPTHCHGTRGLCVAIRRQRASSVVVVAAVPGSPSSCCGGRGSEAGQRPLRTAAVATSPPGSANGAERGRQSAIYWNNPRNYRARATETFWYLEEIREEIFG